MTTSPDAVDSARSRGAMLALGEIERLATELSALMRMGVPVAAGLKELAPTMGGGRLPAFAKQLARKMESGQSLSAALHAERERLPGFFRAVVDAGIRSGDPAAALKAIAETARRLEEHRRAALHALVYPFLIGVAAIAMGGVFLYAIIPSLLQLYVIESAAIPRPLQWVSGLAQFFQAYWWAAALLFLLGGAALWMRRNSWKMGTSARTWLGIGRLPTRRNFFACSVWATMLELLVLLLKRQVPLDESLLLAASVALPAKRRGPIEQLAGRLRAGQRMGEADYLAAGLPQAIATALATPRRPEAMVQVLGQLENEYRWRGNDLRRQFNGPFLTSLTVGIAGLIIVIYLIVAILPVVQVYFDVVNNRIN